MNDSTGGFELQEATEGYVFEVDSLRDVLEEVADARDPRGKRWPQVSVLLFALLAKLAGEDKLRGIAQGINLRIDWLNRTLQLRPRYNRNGTVSGPHATTYSRVMGQAVNGQQLAATVHGYVQGQRRVGLAIQVTIDGQKIRGTVSADNPSGVYLLAVFLPSVGLVLLQAAIQATQNELSLAPTVLECLDLQGKIVTADALFTSSCAACYARLHANACGTGHTRVVHSDCRSRWGVRLESQGQSTHTAPGYCPCLSRASCSARLECAAD